MPDFPMQPLRIAIIGCGSRGRTYAAIAGKLSDRYKIVAAADPHPGALDAVEASAGHPIARFSDGAALIAAAPPADLAIVATQDHLHLAPALGALEAGWHLLLEKPASTTLADCRAILDAARKAERSVILCHVLRHTPFYRKVRGIIDSGRLGRLISIDATEGVEPFHQAHSFVRGHWSRSADSSPMILAKSCHDTDLLAWFAGTPCRRVSSFGSLSFFRPENAPPGAPARCTDSCPHSPGCFYDARRYTTDKRRWLAMLRPDADKLTDEEILSWLATSPWGRCAWRCDNDAVDHQVLALEFADGLTATFTMTAFDSGRRLTINGTEAVLRGGPGLTDGPGGAELWLRNHRTGETEPIEIPDDSAPGYEGHGGGDFGLVNALDGLLATAPPDEWFESHLIAFAAEQSRLDGGATIDLDGLR